MIIYYYFVDLKKYYLNTQKYLMYTNFNEMSYIIQNYNVSKKFVIVGKFYTLFNISNLIFIMK